MGWGNKASAKKESKFFSRALLRLTGFLTFWKTEHGNYLLCWMISTLVILDADHVCSSIKHIEKVRSLESSEMSALLYLTFWKKKERKFGTGCITVATVEKENRGQKDTRGLADLFFLKKLCLERRNQIFEYSELLFHVCNCIHCCKSTTDLFC